MTAIAKIATKVQKIWTIYKLRLNLILQNAEN